MRAMCYTEINIQEQEAVSWQLPRSKLQNWRAYPAGR